ncbi:YbcC family protein [Cerasicoccus fimbriatus]|uniref:YbcC family protein n=1 Tax=Cerasicoccus fimbriatus TaxID=3014554 RepID=UPI0022B3EC20|nr:DUF2309 domain-containing protein [Cerasicoccus sp. TK19100]
MHSTESIEKACQQVAPLWPLANFVAVNPYLGFAHKPFAQTAHYLAQVQDANLAMPLKYYGEQFADGAISECDLEAAISRASEEVLKAFKEADAPLTAAALIQATLQPEDGEEPCYRPGTFSTYLDARQDTHWHRAFGEEAAKWCAAYYDKGQALWMLPGKSEGFYQAWLQTVKHDRTLACMGLKGAHQMLAAMPDSPESAIKDAIEAMDIPAELISEWLYRVLLSLPGWAGHLRYLDREQELRGGSGGELIQLLAILLNYEKVLHAAYSGDEDCMLGWKRMLMEEPVETANELMPLALAQRLVWQSALEYKVEQTLKHSIQPKAIAGAGEQPDVQAAFCIDVRSELFRRNLETALPEIQTIGFAGFFGVPLAHLPLGQQSEQARCPALLAPPVKSCECGHEHDHDAEPHRSARSWRQFKDGAASCFSFVETFGLSYTWKLMQSAMGLGKKQGLAGQPSLADALDLEAKVNLAKGIVHGLSLTKQCGKLILLCGHGSATSNNPYASGLDCGACGGHPGDANARVAATLLNDSEVRKGLAEAGIDLPPQAHFIAGLHNTTTDEVTLFDLESLPSSHRDELTKLQQGLAQAGLWTAAIRAKSLGVTDADSVAAVKSRSADWSQVRPEWGLAGNAGFIVAPRSWTRASDLGGKAFLHEYDPAADPEGSLLEGILAGPLVVGSWINLQYYASSVDNAHYGSGHKAIHNVVGGIGVALGNENDLRPGLPLQSVHDGKKLVHEPVRLHAIVAADTATLDAILERQPMLKQLLDNQWLHLYALGTEGERFIQRQSNGEWKESNAPGRSVPIQFTMA